MEGLEVRLVRGRVIHVDNMMLAGEKNHLNSRLSASQALPQHFSLWFGIILGCLQSFWKQDFQLCAKTVYIWIFCGFFYDFSIISRWFLSLRNTKYHHPEDSFQRPNMFPKIPWTESASCFILQWDGTLEAPAARPAPFLCPGITEIWKEFVLLSNFE